MLKVRGLAEYLLPNTHLSAYVHVHQCIKLDEDVEFSLLPAAQISRKLARTVSDFCSKNVFSSFSILCGSSVTC